MPHCFKRGIACFLCLCILLMTASAFAAGNWYCPQCGRKNDQNYCPNDGTKNPGSSSAMSSYYSGQREIWGLTTMKLATRSGPTTGYTEPGTFAVQNQYVQIFSIAYDGNNVPWVQCEVTYNGMPMRVYTGLKRFDTSTFSVGDIPLESEYYQWTGTLTANKTPLYGPGDGYAAISGTTLGKGKKVTVTWSEGDWYQVQFTRNGQKCRGWVRSQYIQ